MKKHLLIIPLLFILSLSFASAAVTLNTVTFTANSDNTTLIGSANATEPAGSNMTYYYRVYIDGTFSSGSLVTGNTQNVLRNFANVSTGGVAGTYILQVIAGNATANSSALNSSGVTVSFPASSPANILLRVVLSLVCVAVFIVFALYSLLYGEDLKSRLAAVFIAFICLIVVLLTIPALFGN